MCLSTDTAFSGALLAMQAKLKIHIGSTRRSNTGWDSELRGFNVTQQFTKLDQGPKPSCQLKLKPVLSSRLSPRVSSS